MKLNYNIPNPKGATYGVAIAILSAILGTILGAILGVITIQVAKVGMSHTSGILRPFLIASQLLVRVIIIPPDRLN